MLNFCENRKGVYVIANQNSEKYKISKTINLKTKLSQLAIGNPENIKMV